MSSNKDSLPSFSVSADSTNLGQRWKRWLRNFEFYADEKAIEGPVRKRAALLRHAGEEVQDIAEDLEKALDDAEARAAAAAAQQNEPAPQVPNGYDRLVAALNRKFLPQNDNHFQKHIFRGMKPKPGEKAEDFVRRLRGQAAYCGFTDADLEIRDLLIDTCPHRELKDKLVAKLISRGPELTLATVLEKSKVFEQVHRQASSSQDADDDQDITKKVNKLQIRRRDNARNNYKRKEASKGKESACYACGNKGHFRKDDCCPAKKAQCRQCGFTGHFDTCCKSNAETIAKYKQSQQRKEKKPEKRDRKKVRNLQDDDSDSDGSTREQQGNRRYSFFVCANQVKKEDLYPVKIGDVNLNVLIDSGANCNVVSKRDWEYLKQQNVNTKTAKSMSALLDPYGGEPLHIIGKFVVDVRTPSGAVQEAKYYVVEEKGVSILGKKTSTQLGLLHVASVKTLRAENIPEKYPEAFKGIGKLKNFQLDIPIDPKVPPVIQPIRKVPLERLEPMKQLIKELLQADIIEEVNGPTPRLSPAHIVPKNSETGEKKWRLVVDSRLANLAIIRKKFPIRTFDELTIDLPGFAKASKVDFTWSFHQIELTAARELSTFSTPFGIFRYKRLWFGMKNATEELVRILTQCFITCRGVKIAYDDGIITGATEEEHDANLDAFLRKVTDLGLTLRAEKCRFGVKKLVFLGNVITPTGITPTEKTQREILDFRIPTTAAEVRSFLGLMNFVHFYVPELAAISKPLRDLTRKGTVFRWTAEENRSFSELKRRLAEAPALAYFQRDAETSIHVDAGPTALGAVMVQTQRDENGVLQDRIVRYASRSLSDVESRYSQTEKEALGAVWGCEHWMFYLLGRKFRLVTDCKALQFLFKPTAKPCPRLERWVMRLQSYDFDVVHRPGEGHIADPLSRLTKPTSISKDDYTGEEADLYAMSLVRESVPATITLAEIREATAADPVLHEVIASLRSSRWSRELHFYEIIKDELSEVDGVLMRRQQIVIPAT